MRILKRGTQKGWFEPVEPADPFSLKPENPGFILYFILKLVRRRFKPAVKSWVQGLVRYMPYKDFIIGTRQSGKVGFRWV